MARIPKKVTVLVDDREKYPFPFPINIRYFDERGKPHLVKVLVERTRLTTGDYCLKEDMNGCVIERKGRASEIAGNLLTKDRARAVSAFKRLADESRYPVLLLDFPLGQLMGHEGGKPHPGEVASALARVMINNQISVLHVGTAASSPRRRKVGAIMIHLMLESYLGTRQTRRSLPELRAPSGVGSGSEAESGGGVSSEPLGEEEETEKG